MYLKKWWSLEAKRQEITLPVFPDIMLGTTVMVSLPVKDRWELYAALMVPESNRYGAASFPVGVTGAGSSPPANASLNLREPLADAPSSEIREPKAS